LKVFIENNLRDLRNLREKISPADLRRFTEKEFKKKSAGKYAKFAKSEGKISPADNADLHRRNFKKNLRKNLLHSRNLQEKLA